MANFKLRVVTPDKVFFDGEASFITVRSINGDIGIMANHARYVTPLTIGSLKIKTESGERFAAVAGGFLKTGNNAVTIVTPACEWADEIDIQRAERAAEKAKELLRQKASRKEQVLEEAKLSRALNRISIAGKK